MRIRKANVQINQEKKKSKPSFQKTKEKERKGKKMMTVGFEGSVGQKLKEDPGMYGPHLNPRGFPLAPKTNALTSRPSHHTKSCFQLDQSLAKGPN